MNLSTLTFSSSAITNLALIPVVGIDNNVKEEKRRNTDQLKLPELREKFKSGKIMEPHTNPLSVKEITGRR